MSDAALPAGHFRTKNHVLSLDAGFRQWMTAGAGDNYLTGMQIGDPVQSIVLGEVIESDQPGYPVGTLVGARTAWEEDVLDGSDLCSPLEVDSSIPLHQYMGILGPTGMTAWIGLFEVGQPKSVKPSWSVPRVAPWEPWWGNSPRLRGVR